MALIASRRDFDCEPLHLTGEGSPDVRGEDEHTRHGGTTGRQQTVGSFTADRVKRRVRLRTQQAQGVTLRQDGRPEGRDSSLALFTTAVSRQGRRPDIAVPVMPASSLARHDIRLNEATFPENSQAGPSVPAQ